MTIETRQEFSIREVAEATGLSTHTLRYYERVGLIHPIERADSSHRRYTEDDIGWIEFLKKLRATGMSIQNMQIYAELQRQGDETLEQRVAMLEALKDDVEAHIRELHEHLDIVRYKIALYSERIRQTAQEVAS